jgi:4'-phosphopantetheinyl transferase
MRLSPGIVEVWRLRMSAVDLRPLRTLLSAEERKRAARLFDDTRRARFVLTRASLRRILGAYVGGDPAALDLRTGASGKPYLVRDGAAAALRFSVSHADDLALLAFAWNAEIGVDLERARPPRHSERIADRLFDEETRRLIARLPAAERTVAFHHAWTQREAYVKAVGGTLFGTHDPLSLRWPRPDRDVHRVAAGEVWTVASLLPADGYIGTLVVAGETDRLTEREYDPAHR